ncbi:hypothetical protein GUITHDRAFT_155392, partial [Guillardia theta CCMP2712]
MVFLEAGVGLVCVCSGISLMLHSLGKKMGRTPYCESRVTRRLEKRGGEESFFHEGRGGGGGGGEAGEHQRLDEVHKLRVCQAAGARVRGDGGERAEEERHV